LYDIIRNVTGDEAKVIGILPPGSSPHTYELTPQQAKRLQGVAVVFRIGHGLDDWTDAVVDILPGVKRVVVDEGIRLLKESDPGGAHEHAAGEHDEHEGVNPHYWLSIGNGKIIAENVAKEMILLDPENESRYRANLEAYLLKLDAAKEEIERRLQGISTRKMITFHDAWAYYADEFGLEIVGAFEPFPGKLPTPRYLAELHRKARESNVTSLFSEPQLSTAAIEQFSSDMGLKLYVLDPLGGVEGRESYIETLMYNTDIIAEALSDERR
jgi:zinc transport system substrate-binding protein